MGAEERNETTTISSFRSEPWWAVVVELAERQHWVVLLGQLVALGLAPTTVRSAVRAGRLHRVHRGVYAVGRPSLAREGRWMAAVLACGDGALLSHRSAAALWGLVRGDGANNPRHPSAQGPVESRDRSTHRQRRCSHATRRPSTDPVHLARPHAGFAGDASRANWHARSLAEQLRLFDRRATDDVLSRSDGRAGAAALRAAVGAWEEPPFTRSVAERILIELIRASDLPRPLVNQTVAGHEVDLWWPDHDVVAEMDGYEFHSSRNDFERDHEMSLDLGAAGVKLVRISWRQLDRPAELTARLAASLGRPRRGVRVA